MAPPPPPRNSDGRENRSQSMTMERTIRTTVPEEVRAVSEPGAKQERRRSPEAVVRLRTRKRGLSRTTMTECLARTIILVEVWKTKEAASKRKRHPFETTVSIGVKTQREQRQTMMTRRSIRISVLFEAQRTEKIRVETTTTSVRDNSRDRSKHQENSIRRR